ncbi:hypothetical protein [Vibrio agarivorans]|uniref:hypothetical protein n=1 Tax=Vibrio agarivorans TaxID=153622 RepID=UPI002231BEB2|nr:hypothetical protein [Vibrio agarivorans]MDN3659966.1 hypothetical protein [Vibrio agarivorans]
MLDVSDEAIKVFLANLSDSQKKKLQIVDDLLAGEPVKDITVRRSVTRDYVYQVKRKHKIN